MTTLVRPIRLWLRHAQAMFIIRTRATFNGPEI